MSEHRAQHRSVGGWHYLWQLARYRPWQYVGLIVLRTLIWAAVPQATGFIMRAFFNSLTGSASVSLSPLSLSALLVATGVGRAAVVFADILAYFGFMYTSSALVRKNLLEHVLDQPGARPVPHSPGEAISRFRGDVRHVVRFAGVFPELVGQVLFAIAAVVVMAGINARIASVVFSPLVVIVIILTLAMRRVHKYRQASRRAAGRVTGFVAELFGSAQAVKVATAEDHVIHRFRELSEARREAALKDRLYSEGLHSVFGNIVNLGTGAILLLAGQSMSVGTFTVGDFALFVYYLGFVTMLIHTVGHLGVRYRQTGVSIDRLNELLQGAAPGRLVQHGPVYMRGELPEVPHAPKSDEHRLRGLDARGLTYLYPDSHRGIDNVDLSLEPGSFTVITGRIGSGKTTLLRTLLGLLPKERGEIRWNGEPVEDPATFMVPPRCAYTAQVPTLFSESVRENILMGLPEEAVDLEHATRLAVLDEDLAELQHGLDTVIGVKGVKLSGGQRQRAAAARMFVRDPELLVFDDLSSALDVETERALWERVFERRDATCLVVSHRRTVLRRADKIIVLVDGKVHAQGSLDELLESCEEMQRLWRGDVDGEGEAVTDQGQTEHGELRR